MIDLNGAIDVVDCFVALNRIFHIYTNHKFYGLHGPIVLTLSLDGSIYLIGYPSLQQFCYKKSLVMRKPAFCSNCAADQRLYYLNPKFQASSYLLWLYSLVCIGPGRKPQRPVFSQRG